MNSRLEGLSAAKPAYAGWDVGGEAAVRERRTLLPAGEMIAAPRHNGRGTGAHAGGLRGRQALQARF